MNKTCEWRQLQCIELWDPRNLLFFPLKRHSGTNLCLKLPPSPTHPPVRQSDAEMIDRQGPEVGESQEQPWEKSATSGEIFPWKNPPKMSENFPGFFSCLLLGRRTLKTFSKRPSPVKSLFSAAILRYR